MLAVAVVLLGCGSTPPKWDAATSDAIGDGATGDVIAGNGVACGDAGSTTCSIPDQVCCDLTTGTDQCIAAGSSCAGTSLACDGPEDCPLLQECCLFPDRSQCMDDGICGTTGVITEVMCHVDGDCATGLSCCGTAPGPLVDVYGVCRAGGCPQ
jgi:hypothetical protein